jgi:uncharacterized YigZ family protein
MSVFEYRTIAAAGQGTYKEKGSKFLAFAYPVASEEEVKTKLAALKKEYFDARHHCFAYVLGPDKKKFRAFDDGEPNHSAGDPILGQLRSREITNVLVVVVRYFGGVKLGVGGLISAYKAAAEDALNHSGIVEKEIAGTIVIRYDYNATPAVMRVVKIFELDIKEQKFKEKCFLRAEYPMRVEGELREKLELLKATGWSIEVE